MNLSDLVSRAEPSVLRISTPTGTGSGFLYDGAGLAVTNAHVVGGSHFVEVELGGQKCGAILIGKDDVVDLAVIRVVSDRVEGDLYPTIPIGTSDYIRRGEDVVVIGYPLGEVLRGSPTITRGIISAKGRSGAVSYLQTDAAINPGTSGGPLLNCEGDVVGIVSSKIHQHGEAAVEGIGLAIDACEFTDRIKRLESGISVGESFRNWVYEYSFDIPQGWHPLPIEDWGQVVFQTDDRKACFRVDAVDLEGSEVEHDAAGLRVFAEWVLSNAMDNVGSKDDFELEEFDAVGEFRWAIRYVDHKHLTRDTIFCTFHHDVERMPWGFYITTFVYDGFLSNYNDDRNEMLYSFRC